MIIPQHVVVAAALVRRGRVLLCHRHPDRAWYPDVWDLPGGHVEPGEAPADALARELQEELGVAATVTGPPRWSLADAEMQLSVWRVTRWQGEPAVVERAEHDRLGWFTRAQANLLPLAHPGYPRLLGSALLG